MSFIINGESETCPISEIAMIILSLKFICFSHLAALVCFLAVVPFVAFPILLQQLHDKNERQKKILSPLSTMRNTIGLIENYARKFHQEANGSVLSKR